MKNITKEELEKILENHKEWLKDNTKGKKAVLIDTNLSRVNLNGANLSYAVLCRANLTDANLTDAYLRSANLIGADLCGANLRGANLTDAYLRGANLIGADLCGANLRDAILSYGNLIGADLCGANLRGAKLYSAILDGISTDSTTIGFYLACPEKGSFIGYKKVEDYIIELEITNDAKRSSATSRKCRCSKAKVISITNKDGNDSGLTEIYNSNYNGLLYKVGEIVEVDDFDENRWAECSTGIHFFITRVEAVEY